MTLAEFALEDAKFAPLAGERAGGERDDHDEGGGEDRGHPLHGPLPFPSQIVTGTS